VLVTRKYVLQNAAIPPSVQPLLTQHWEDRLQLAKNPHLSKKVHLELLTDALRIAPTHYLGVVYDYLCNLVGRPLPADLIPQVVTALATYSTMPYTQLQLLEFLQHNPLSTKDLLTLAPCKLSIETRGYLYHTYATNHEFQKASLSYYRPDLSVTIRIRPSNGTRGRVCTATSIRKRRIPAERECTVFYHITNRAPGSHRCHEYNARQTSRSTTARARTTTRG
jgi:hypothetical protein